MNRSPWTVVLAAALVSLPVFAGEGMWQPRQLPQLATQLEAAGLQIPPESLSELTAHPMGAVVSLGGCSASFVSPDGLIITNHHCVMGALQYNSSEERNLMQDGFLARDLAEEVHAGPGSRVYVTVEVEDVTAAMRQGLDGLAPHARYQTLEDRQKAMVAECEAGGGHRCRVAAFHGGLQYFRIRQMEIQDVRLVYAPAGSVGRYGGDVDNWMWPRQTGDYSFYRAYVGADGKPAEHSAENVPFKPSHHLKVTDAGLDEGDFVMVVGYPGFTSRYRLAVEVENQFEWFYPTLQKQLRRALDIIDETTAGRPDAAIKYAGRVAGINNAMKNFEGMVAGYAKSDILERKAAVEAELQAWIEADPARRAKYSSTLEELRQLVAEAQGLRDRGLYYSSGARGASLLGVASRLYRLSHERQLADAQRDPAYQERNWSRIQAGLTRLDRSYDPAVDRALWREGILNYVAIPTDQHVEAFDRWLGIDGNSIDEARLDEKLDEIYAKTELGELEVREAWFTAEPARFEASDDPFIQLAVALYETDRQFEAEAEERAGRFNELRPAYMEAMVAFREGRGKAVYPDANSTLRVTFGNVTGYSPADAVEYRPFSTARGLLAKETGEEPFNSPPELLEALREKRFGHYADEDLGTLPVNFLANLDITGGNSGSPTLNGRGELVGLVFDGNWESIIADWDFLPDVTRSIHVDVRYVLWVMDMIDGADHLIEEMGLVPTPDARGVRHRL